MRNYIRPSVAAFFILTCAVAGDRAARAEETRSVTRTITVYSLSDAPEFEKAVKAVCADTSIKLSDKAKTICASGAFPTLTKAKRFRNAGVGAELNTLASQR